MPALISVSSFSLLTPARPAIACITNCRAKLRNLQQRHHRDADGAEALPRHEFIQPCF
jgi:hypothetical protein